MPFLSTLFCFAASQRPTKVHGMGTKMTKEIVYGRGFDDALRRLRPL